jgi:hypothetical protein
VGVAQLAERRFVEPDVAGSYPVAHTERRMMEAAAYWIEEIGTYRVHHHVSEKKHVISLEGSWPHHNPRVGNHTTIVPMSKAQYRSLVNGKFDRCLFEQRIIRTTR